MPLCLDASVSGCLYVLIPLCLNASVSGCLCVWMPLCLDASVSECLCVSMHLCLDASMSGCIYVWMHLYVLISLCLNASVSGCIYVWMHLCLYDWMISLWTHFIFFLLVTLFLRSLFLHRIFNWIFLKKYFNNVPASCLTLSVDASISPG